MSQNGNQLRAANRELVVCSLESWDDIWRRNQFLVRELLANDPTLRIIFVEPPVDILALLLRRIWPFSQFPRLRSVDGEGRVQALRQLKLLPRVIGPFADYLLCRSVKKVAKEVGFTTPTLWVNDSTYAPLSLTTGWPTLYDITDDWLLEKVTNREQQRREANERTLLMQAEIVVVCSPALLASRSTHRNVLLIPNAVDVERFRQPQARPDDLPQGTTAVYVGTLHESRLDLGLLEAIATTLPDLQVVLVGPNALSAASLTRLAALTNIYLLGPRPYARIPAYLQHATIVIIPHLITPFTESLDPIKAYECVAVGTPTIATPLAGFRDLGHPIRIATVENFVTEVCRALDERPTSRPDSEVPTWVHRGHAFAQALQQARSGTGGQVASYKIPTNED